MSRLLLFCVTSISLFAADNSKVWTSAEIKAMAEKMAAKKLKVGTESLGAFGNYQMTISYRNASGEAELHQTKNDIFYIVRGTATLITGGAIPNSKTTQPHEIRGPAVVGGQKHKLGPGDFLTIPAGVPHQMLLDPGSEITYAVVKVDAK